MFRFPSNIFSFFEDPHGFYNHGPADVWKAIDAHEVQPGMSELQTAFAIGVGVPEGSGDYGSRTLHYANGAKPLVIKIGRESWGERVEVSVGAVSLKKKRGGGVQKRQNHLGGALLLGRRRSRDLRYDRHSAIARG